MALRFDYRARSITRLDFFSLLYHLGSSLGAGGGGGGAESGGASQKFMSSSSSREHLSTTSSATSGLVPSPVYLVSIQCSNNTIGVFSIDVNILCILLRKHFLKVSYPPHGPVSGTAEGEVGATDNGDSIATDRQRFEEKAEVPQEESSAISANSRAFRPLATLRGHVADDWPVEMSVLRGKDHCFRLYGKVKQSSSHASLHGKSGPGYLVGHEGAGGGAVRSGSSSNLLFAPPSDANPNAAFANINGRDSMELERDKYFVDGAEDEEDDVANYDIWTGDEGGMAVRAAAQSPPPSSASAAGVMAATACGSRNVSQTTRWNKSLIIATGSLSGEVIHDLRACTCAVLFSYLTSPRFLSSFISSFIGSPVRYQHVGCQWRCCSRRVSVDHSGCAPRPEVVWM